MSKVQRLKDSINERLSAAAEEIFRVFQETVSEYEKEIDRQRVLLDIAWKPEIKLHRTEHQHVCKEEEEVLTDQQLCDQESNTSLDQEDPEPLQIKEEEEEEEVCTSLEVEQLMLKQETETFMLTPTCDESEDQRLYLSPDETQSETEKEHLASMLVESFVEPEPTIDDQLLSHYSHVAESQDHNGGEYGSKRKAEPKLEKKKTNNEDTLTTLKIDSDTFTEKKCIKCEICGKIFKWKCNLQRHLRIHTGEKPYACNTCEKRFTQPGALKVHLRIHTGEKPYSCSTCEKKFAEIGKLKAHMRIHTGEKPYPCGICDRRFSQPVGLNLHMRTHTDLQRQHVCKEEEVLTDKQLCGQESNTSLDQEDQVPLQIKEEPEEVCTSLEVEQLVLKEETQTFMLPPTCYESEDQMLYLSPDETQSEAEKEHLASMLVHDQLLSHYSHVAESTDHNGGKNGSKRQAEPKLKKKKANNEDNSTTLQIDGDTFTEEKCLKCEICGKTFKWNSNLHRHLRVHTGEKPYACNTCNKRFSQPGALKIHMRVHTGEKPYACSTCEKRFAEIGKLKVHMRIHTGEKPYPCGICDRRFSQPGALNLHMRTHTGEKPYPCNTCEKSFPHLGALNLHTRIHTGEKPYPCNTCGRRFSYMTTVKRHMRTHTGEKPYTCNTCGRTFSVLGALKAHIRIHTGEKPYCCKTCGRLFRLRHNLTIHMKTHAVGKALVTCQSLQGM